MGKFKKILLNIIKIFYEPEPDRYINCIYCGNKLVRQQRKFCSISCGGYFFRRKNNKLPRGTYPEIDDKKKKLDRKKHLTRKMSYKLYPSLKGIKCEGCNKSPAVERHHEDYDKPKEVNFLCWSCHGKVHAGIISVNSSKEQKLLKGGYK